MRVTDRFEQSNHFFKLAGIFPCQLIAFHENGRSILSEEIFRAEQNLSLKAFRVNPNVFDFRRVDFVFDEVRVERNDFNLLCRGIAFGRQPVVKNSVAAGVAQVPVHGQLIEFVSEPAVDESRPLFHVVENRVDVQEFKIFCVGFKGEQFQFRRKLFAEINSGRADVRAQVEEDTPPPESSTP